MSGRNATAPDPEKGPRPPMPPALEDDHLRLRWRLARAFARTVYLLAFRGRVLGVKNVPRKGGVLLVSNHQSFIDPILASLVFDRECNFMARESLFYHRAFAWLISAMNAFPVRRGTADMRAVKETLRRLKKGQMVLVFPEGTRTTDGRIGELQPGAAAIAKQAKATVVPTMIEGAYNVWPRQALLPRPARVIVRYAPPIGPEEAAQMPKEVLTARIGQTLRQMQAEVRRIYGFPPVPGDNKTRSQQETVRAAGPAKEE